MASKTFYAVIAGVGAGTGGAVARRFAQAYPVVLLARNPESYNDLVTEITKAGGQAFGISTDVTDPAAVSQAFKTIKEKLPNTKLAAAIYNASGGMSRKPFLEMKLEDLEVALSGNA